MMLAYQPVKSLATVNVGIGRGLSAAKRIIPIIDMEIQINKNDDKKNLIIQNGDIKFQNVNFNYQDNKSNKVLNDVNLEISGGKMTLLWA